MSRPVIRINKPYLGRDTSKLRSGVFLAFEIIMVIILASVKNQFVNGVQAYDLPEAAKLCIAIH
jgi:hypothetical protein